jgi:hypothetical protein
MSYFVIVTMIPTTLIKLVLSLQGDAIIPLPIPSWIKPPSHSSFPGVTSPLRNFPLEFVIGPRWTPMDPIGHLLFELFIF